MPPPRAPWLDFPDAFIHAPESTVKKHPCYRAAKSGDADAAAALVAAAFDDAQAMAMAEQVATKGCIAPTLVSAHAYENDGVNAIPEVFAMSWGAGWAGLSMAQSCRPTWWRTRAPTAGHAWPARQRLTVRSWPAEAMSWSTTFWAWAVHSPACAGTSNRVAAQYSQPLF
jgi:hypothetical protein